MEQPRPWFVQAFGPHYCSVYNTRDDRLAFEEAGFLTEALRLHAGRRCLDIGCGQGRHLRALIPTNANMIGIDLSPHLLRRAHESGVRVVRADMRALPFGAASFDAAYSAFTSFGYFATEAEDIAVLREVCRVLTIGGRYVLDLADPAQVRAHLVARSERNEQGATIVEQRRIEGQRVLKHVRFIADGVTEEWEESVRLYTPAEADAALAAAGFKTIMIAGGLCRESSAEPLRHVHVAEKSA